MRLKGNITNQEYRNELWQLALPVSLQCLLQSSFSVIDQIMIGQLGSTSIAAIGIGGKYISLLTVMIQAIAAVSGIIIAQAEGKQNRDEISKGFCTSLMLALLLATGFTACSFILPHRIMGIYSEDSAAIQIAAAYLRIYAISFLPMTITSVVSAFLRCMKETQIPLYASMGAAVFNTGLNYLLIYGKLGMPQMGVQGAALASVIAQVAGCAIIMFFFWTRYGVKRAVSVKIYRKKNELKKYLQILLPMFLCEFLWALGENVYGYIYGHMGTKACAAMTLINPIVSLMIGALSGVSQAAGIMIGKLLGAGKEEAAYVTGKRLMRTGLAVSAALSVLLLVAAPAYVRIFNVEADVRYMTNTILIAFAVVCPIKVANMILGGGIIRSGGKTGYVMVIDIIGTWGFGVPLGFLTAFVLEIPIAWVYFILSMEELVRLGISLVLFRKKCWIQQL